MSINFFSKKNDQEKSNEEKVTSSFFQRIALNTKAQPNKSLTHGFNEPGFDLSSSSFDNLPQDLGQDLNKSEPNLTSPNAQSVNVNPSQGNPTATSTAFNNFQSPNQTVNSETLNNGSTTANTQSVTPQENTPNNHYYTYTGNNSYLNEAGRDSDHLYIGPGEPLKPYTSKPEETEATDATTVNPSQGSKEATLETVSKASEPKPDVEEDVNIYPAPGQSLAEFEEARKKLFESKTKATSQNQEQEAVANTTLQDETAKAPLEDSSLKAVNNNASTEVQVNVAPQATPSTVSQNKEASAVSGFNNSDLFANVKQTNFDAREKATEVNKAHLPAYIFVLLFFRRAFASFFTFTNLGVFFPKTSLQVIGPSSPAFMVLPYFVFATLIALLGLFINETVSSQLASRISLLVLFLVFGAKGLRGISYLTSALTIRKIDMCTKAIVVVVFCTIFVSTFDFYLTGLKVSYNFALAFGVIGLLCGLVGTSMHIGVKDCPISSYGTLSGAGIIAASLFSVLLTFLVLDWQIALSMIGICILSRVLLGQFVRLRRLSSSEDLVCGAALITLIMLMLDLCFAGKSLPILSALF